MGVQENLNRLLNGIRKTVDVVDEVAAAAPKVKRGIEQIKKSIDDVTRGVQDIEKAVAPITRAVAPYPAEVQQAASTLNLTLPISKAALDTAYKEAAREAHPDRGGNTDRMKRVNAARETLRPWCHD